MMDLYALFDRLFTEQVWVRRAVALGLVVVCALALSALRSLLARRLSRSASAGTNRLDDVLAEMAKRTSMVFALGLSILMVLNLIPLSPKVERFAGGVGVVLCLIQAGVWSSIALRAIIERKIASGSDGQADPARAGVARMAVFGARVVAWSVLILVALSNLGIAVTALVAGLGVGGVAVALATQNILGDLFASFSILVDKPFVPGDFIVVGDFMGSVEQVGVKTTRVRSLGGEQIVFANSDLLQSRLRNYKRMSERRISFRLGVVYQTPPEKLRAIPNTVRAIIQAQEKTRFDRAHFVSYGDSALLFEVVYYVLDPDYNLYMDIHQAVNLAICERFAAARIDFAYPTQTLIVQTRPPELGDSGAQIGRE